jgi:hypothetical protein
VRVLEQQPVEEHDRVARGGLVAPGASARRSWHSAACHSV